MSDPRNNADDAYAAFLSMSEGEWQGLLVSLLSGGVLQPAEQIGFERALIGPDSRDNRPCDCIAQKFDRPMPHVPGCPRARS